jgi:TolB-like protein/Tfp pilus assembly protein PilF
VAFVTELSHAVFLSYASQDAQAAHKICEALRGAGVEVWFDQSELRGGDAWDHKIRREIRDCALFIPVISANTVARHEGYFRLEWDLADQRTHMIARNRAFVVPVCVDATPETSADAPESFQRVQWTRLPAGDTPAAFVERVKRLLTPESSPAPDRARFASSAATTPPRGLRRPGILYAAITAVALLLALGYFGLERLNRSTPSAPGASIAVLPLTNESGEASQQYFSDGISEDLITALSQFPGLKVIGRTSAFKFRDSKEDSRSIGAKLGVAHLLEGSVRRAGDMVRVSAELIDTADGSTQWSERFDRPYKDLFALQDEITRAVATALKTKLQLAEKAAAQSDRPPSGSLEAYNALLAGRFYGARDTEADTRKAIEQYTAATQLDSRYALAWSNLSEEWAGLAEQWLEGEAAQQAYAKARAAADEALALEPDLAAAHIARGYVFRVADFNWRGAEAEYRRALELAPHNAAIKYSLANQLATIGQVEQAVELTRQALTTEPLRATWHEWLAMDLMGLNRLDEAEAAIRKAIDLQPHAEGYYQALAMIAIQRADPKAALAAAEQEPAGDWRDIALAMAHQIGSDHAAADAALKDLIDKHAQVAAYNIAEVYALRNDADKTFEWLARAWSNRDPGITSLLNDPFILRYRDDPRFAAFLSKVGLPVPGDRQHT